MTAKNVIRKLKSCLLCIVFAMIAAPAFAGPPYVSDDPEPTDYKHFEIYLFGAGTKARDGSDGAFGIDFNYGAAPDLQLTAVLPIEYERPVGAPHAAAVGNIELAAKYKFLHKEQIGWDVALFPRVFLPSTSHRVGERHASLLLPLWLERDWGDWSMFGGGGCSIHRGGDALDFCLVSWALARQITPHLQIGAEVFHQTPDAKGARASTGANLGLRYDMSETLHILGSVGRGLRNADGANQLSWYASLLLIF